MNKKRPRINSWSSYYMEAPKMMIKSINNTKTIAEPDVEPQLFIKFLLFICFQNILWLKIEIVLIYTYFIALI